MRNKFFADVLIAERRIVYPLPNASVFAKPLSEALTHLQRIFTIVLILLSHTNFPAGKFNSDYRQILKAVFQPKHFRCYRTRDDKFKRNVERAVTPACAFIKLPTTKQHPLNSQAASLST